MAEEKPTLLCFGDSNTHGTGPMAALDDRKRFGPAVRWPGVAAVRLPGWRVIEEGHPGRTTVHADPVEGEHRNGLPALQVALESHRPIDWVALMLGTNDFKARFSVTPMDVALSLKRLMLLIRQSDCGPQGRPPKILLIAPPPLQETGCLAGMFLGAAEKSRALAGYCASYAAELGVRFLDAGTVISVSPVDGVHFDAEAHAVLGAAVAERVG